MDLLKRVNAEQKKIAKENKSEAGKSKMQLAEFGVRFDENGDIIRFPKKLAKAEEEYDISAAYTLKLSTVKNILAVNKASLADNMELPVLTCYYCGDSVITSDRKKICKNAFLHILVLRLTAFGILG